MHKHARAHTHTTTTINVLTETTADEKFNSISYSLGWFTGPREIIRCEKVTQFYGMALSLVQDI